MTLQTSSMHCGDLQVWPNCAFLYMRLLHTSDRLPDSGLDHFHSKVVTGDSLI